MSDRRFFRVTFGDAGTLLARRDALAEPETFEKAIAGDAAALQSLENKAVMLVHDMMRRPQETWGRC